MTNSVDSAILQYLLLGHAVETKVETRVSPAATCVRFPSTPFSAGRPSPHRAPSQSLMWRLFLIVLSHFFCWTYIFNVSDELGLLKIFDLFKQMMSAITEICFPVYIAIYYVYTTCFDLEIFKKCIFKWCKIAPQLSGAKKRDGPVSR